MAIRPNGFPIHDFINSFILWFEDNVASFFAVILFIAIALYLLWITITGTFKFGLRVFILFPLHPMQVGATWMNAF